MQGLAIGLFEGERDAFFDVFGLARCFDHHRRLFLGLSAE